MAVETPWKTLDADSIRWTDSGNFPSTSPGVVGNGALELRYRRMNGQTFFRFMLIFGSTTVAPVGGGGLWYFELPEDVLPDEWFMLLAGATWIRSGSSVGYFGPALYIVNADNSGIAALAAQYLNADGLTRNVNAIQPLAWAENDALTMTGFFESLDN